MQRLLPIFLTAAIVSAPLGASGADLVVWWEKGFTPQEDEAVREIIAAFEQQSGKEVELVQPTQDLFPDNILATFGTRASPDFAVGTNFDDYIAKWAFDDRLVDLAGAMGGFSHLFDPEALNAVTLPNARTGQEALYALPIGRITNYLHIWKSLLEEAGFTLADIPSEWEAFWAFWCDRVQPAVRQVNGGDVWGIGLSMSGEATDTWVQFRQFVAVYEADYVTRAGRLVIDDPEVRQGLVKAIDSYTAIYRKGCTPPGSENWTNIDNNEDFLAQRVVMTANQTLSIPNAIKRDRPDDYHENIATIEWPLGPAGKPFPIASFIIPAVVFSDGGHVATAKEFVRFLVAEGWLAHYLDFSSERFLPAMPALLDQPFWLDPSDQHRMAGAMQLSSRPLDYDYGALSGNWRHGLVNSEGVWAKAVHRVVAKDISPEQAVDDAIARVKHILSE
jgi:multiple sugar transport system substrate-binding protein